MPKKQQELEGVGQTPIKEIDEAAEEYVQLRDSRMATLKKEIDAKKTLIDLMHEHGVTSYKFEDGDDVEREARLEAKEKLTVRVAGSEEESSEEESED